MGKLKLDMKAPIAPYFELFKVCAIVCCNYYLQSKDWGLRPSSWLQHEGGAPSCAVLATTGNSSV